MFGRRAGNLLPLALCWASVAAVAAEPDKPRLDAFGDLLPPGVLARLGTLRFRVEGDPCNAILSPDGKQLAVTVDHTRISLLDPVTGQEVRRMRVDGGGFGRLAFSPDGKLLAAPGFYKVIVFDTATGKDLAQLGEQGESRLNSLAFSGDGRRLATCGTDKEDRPVAIVWDLQTHQPLRSFPFARKREVRVTLSPDGKVLASWGGLDKDNNARPPVHPGTIQLWDVATGKEVRRLPVESAVVGGATFAPDGKRLAVAQAGRMVSVWDVAGGKQLHRLAGRPWMREVLRFSPDGKVLAAGSHDGIVLLWDVETGQEIGVSAGSRCHLGSLAFVAPDRVLAAGLLDGAVRVWDLPKEKSRDARQAHTGPITAIAFSRDGKEVSSAGPDGVRVWDAASGKALRHPIVRPDEEQCDAGRGFVVLSPNGRYAGRRSGFAPQVRLVELATRKLACELEVVNPQEERVSVAFSADGTTAAAVESVTPGAKDGLVVRVWDLRTGRPRSSFRESPAPWGNSLALSADGRLVTLQSHWPWQEEKPRWGGSEVSVREAATGKQVARFALPDGTQVSVLAVSPDGSLLACGTPGQSMVWIVELASTPLFYPLKLQRYQAVAGLVFAPDGRSLAALAVEHGARGNERKAVLLELASRQLRSVLVGHRNNVSALAFSPDGRTLATGSSDTTVLLWDLAGRHEDLRPKNPLTDRDLAGLWQGLADEDARLAHRTMLQLAAAPPAALRLLGKELTPVPGRPLDDVQIGRLLADLDADAFDTRERASQALRNAAHKAKRALQQALQTNPSPEKKQRLQDLLAPLEKPGREEIRQTRALEMLELLGTPEARLLLRALAGGNPDSPLTGQAGQGLQRLERLAPP